MVNQKYLDKAEILVEALPYIQRFNRKIIVIKYGGSAMLDVELQKNVIEDVVLLKLVGFKPIIVHGGGKEINKWLDKVGMESRFENGLRVTDAGTMELVEMVLGKVNQDLVTLVQSMGIKAAGISGKDGGLLTAEKKTPGGKDIGFVGEVTGVDTKIIRDLLRNDFLPIIFPIGMDNRGQTYNINADEAAGVIASSLEAEKLVYLSDVEGVRGEGQTADDVISELNVTEARELIRQGIINGGMIPKIDNCIEAIESGVSRIHIMDGRIPHSLLLEIFTDKGIGTAILQESGEKYYNEQ
ncbi:MAG: acetylglutamate kinase [Clostridiales bacterium]|nr:acetylglutamate kinase [Clostridiales bacterium]